ncbi:MAG: hypothetical protein KatS3mg084_0474 [Candidatus Dojkabacteria bacterium]|nr:MAG: hypothetical protein KatS3mg084_0474 [Candidatus Dojkabacteria bacterium]
MYASSPAAKITEDDLKKIQDVYSWGDHATAGYLKSFTETDPKYSSSPASSITASDIAKWNSKENSIPTGTTSQYLRGDKTWQTFPTCTPSQALAWNGTNLVCVNFPTYTETDPIFTASPANSITNTMISNWNTAFSWGNHTTAGYLTSESDPVFSASVAASITAADITNWNNKENAISLGTTSQFLRGDKTWQTIPTCAGNDRLIWNGTGFACVPTGTLTAETDPVFSASPAGTITNAMISNWNTAYSWGNHATAGYLTSETDPSFSASPAGSITSTDISNWNTAFSWGNHAAAGYLTSESDPIFSASPASSITNSMITNWNTAYSWGNHASAGYLTSETDPVFSASPASSITNSMITNWNTAYSWGNHASAGYFNSINGITGPTLTLSVGNAGSDFNISNSGSNIVLNLPDASNSARGVVNTSAQTFAGTKTFTNAPIFSTMTPGSIFFAGAGGLVSQNNPNLFWDNTNARLGLGTNTPTERLHIINGNIRMDGYGVFPNISTRFFPSSSTVPYSFYSLTTTGWGQGFQLSVNAVPSTVNGPGHAYQHMVYMVDPGPYNTKAGALYFDGNGPNWSFFTTPPSTGYGTPATMTENANISPYSIWLSPTGSDSTFHINNLGNVGIGTNSPTARLTVNGSVRLDLTGTGTGWAVCHSGSATATDDVNLVDCTSTPSADYMEMYPVESNAQIGDILMASNDYVLTKDSERIVKLVKSNSTNKQKIIGVMSDINKAGDFNSIGHNINDSDNPQPVALAGRVYVNMDPTSPDIEPGDMITVSNVPGKGTKLTGSGFVVGKALEAWSSASGQTKVMIYIMNFYYNQNSINEYFTLSGSTLTTDYSLVVNGSITANSLSLASGKFTVASNGDTVIDAVLRANQAVIRNLIVDKLSVNTSPLTGDPVIGSGVIPVGAASVFINNSNVTSDSKIFISIKSSSSNFDTIAISAISPGVGFEVRIKEVNNDQNTIFDYWIVN